MVAEDRVVEVDETELLSMMRPNMVRKLEEEGKLEKEDGMVMVVKETERLHADRVSPVRRPWAGSSMMVAEDRVVEVDKMELLPVMRQFMMRQMEEESSTWMMMEARRWTRRSGLIIWCMPLIRPALR